MTNENYCCINYIVYSHFLEFGSKQTPTQMVIRETGRGIQNICGLNWTMSTNHVFHCGLHLLAILEHY